MMPFIVGVGGAHSKVGKTTIVCQILRRLNGWGAIKNSKTQLHSSIVDTSEILRQKNKDTRRFIDAGAQEVLWVQSPPENLKETLQIAVDRLSHLRGIIIEGNSAVEALKPDIIVFLYGSGELKRGADRILRMSDAVIYDNVPPPGVPERAKKFSFENKEKYINFIIGLITEKENKRMDKGGDI